MPRQLLDDYKVNRHRSTLGQILAAAKQLRDLVDRAVILASPQIVEAGADVVRRLLPSAS